MREMKPRNRARDGLDCVPIERRRRERLGSPGNAGGPRRESDLAPSASRRCRRVCAAEGMRTCHLPQRRATTPWPVWGPSGSSGTTSRSNAGGAEAAAAWLPSRTRALSFSTATDAIALTPCNSSAERPEAHVGQALSCAFGSVGFHSRACTGLALGARLRRDVGRIGPRRRPKPSQDLPICRNLSLESSFVRGNPRIRRP